MHYIKNEIIGDKTIIERTAFPKIETELKEIVHIQIVKRKIAHSNMNEEILYNNHVSIKSIVSHAWFFTYLQAKYQIENPKSFTFIREIRTKEPVPISYTIKKLKDKITRNKAIITINKNKIEEANNSSDMFIKTHPKYIFITQKLKDKIKLVNDLEIELKKLKNEH